jgi:hypothetical protein
MIQINPTSSKMQAHPAGAFDFDEAAYARADDLREATDYYRRSPEQCRIADAFVQKLILDREGGLRAAYVVHKQVLDVKFERGAWYACDLCSAHDYALWINTAKLAAEQVRQLERQNESIRCRNARRAPKPRLSKREWFKQKRRQQRSNRVLASKVIREMP